MGTLKSLLFAAVLVVLVVLRASAAAIRFTETVIASGSLGNNAFTNALVTITADADTANVTNVDPGFRFLNNTSSTLTVAGLGSAKFTGGTRMFNNQTNEGAGISALTTNVGIADILDTENSVFGTYNLTSPIGPVSGAPLTNNGLLFATDAGAFVIRSFSGSATFGAAVPEPTGAPFGIAMSTILVLRLRSKPSRIRRLLGPSFQSRSL